MIWRVRLIVVLILLSFFLILTRLFYWQVIRGPELSSQGKKQYTSVVFLKPARGQIRAHDGFPLVSEKLAYLVFANPNNIKEKNKVSKTLSQLLNIDEATLSASLGKDLQWVALAHNVTSQLIAKIEQLKINGIGFEREDVRFYPESSMAAHLLGIVASSEEGEDRGYFGLEGYYDRQLKGRSGEVRRVIDVFGRPVLFRNPFMEDKVDGRSLTLYIDRTIQFIVENKLREGVEKYGAKRGSVAIMDPKTGGILALASYPSYDPAHFQTYSESDFKNPFVSEAYEPGSIFKVLVMAGALNENVVKPTTVCDICSGPVTIGDYTIRTWDNKYYPNTDMMKVIEHSDNTGMVYVAQELGLDKLFGYISSFGIGDVTGIDLQEETSPNLRPKDKWYPIDLATTGFGQGIAVTGIQMLRAVSSIANGGNLMEPHVVEKITPLDGKEITIPPKVVRNVISEKTAKIVTEMMVNAVDNGEARFAKPPGYRVAGKTGTAQIPISGHYDPNKTVTSFVGFAPADDPKFVMLVKLDEPSSSPFGAETAAPLFFTIARDLFTYYNIAPSE